MKIFWVLAYAFASITVVRDLTFLLTGFRPVSTSSIALALIVLLVFFIANLIGAVKKLMGDRHEA